MWMNVSKFRINTNERRIGCNTIISLWFPGEQNMDFELLKKAQREISEITQRIRRRTAYRSWLRADR